MSPGDAEQRLASARAHFHAIAESASVEEFSAAWNQIKVAERDLSRLRGEEYAIPVDLGVQWDTGAPLPYVLTASGRVLVLFYLSVPRPGWDGTSVEVIDPTSERPAGLGLIEFTGVHSIKFGGPNDEAIAGHPLYGRGLSAYRAHRIENSHWIAQEEQINSVHYLHRGGWHEWLSHYVLCFHDETLECLARSWRSESLTSSLPDALHDAARRILT